MLPRCGLLVLLAALVACDDDGRGADSGGDVAPDAEETGPDGDPDLDEPDAPVAGAITLVGRSMLLSDERICDLDGDGLDDNALADLGPSLSPLFAMSINTLLAERMEQAFNRVGLHFPAVADLRGPDDPDTMMILFEAADVDEPENPEDDFSGEEPFHVKPSSLDACGEPLHTFPGTAIRDGELTSPTGDMPIPIPGATIVARSARGSGTIEARGTGAELRLCMAFRVREAGALPSFTGADDLSLLEVLIVGGAPFGFPSVPGLTPDLDLDGDGLERFVLDEEGRLETCVDGDSTEIPGRDCWADDRIGDALSITADIEAVSAVFAGRAPGWEEDVAGECEGAPERSAWDG